MGSLIVIVLLAGLLWIFIVLPSRRRQRQHAEMQDAIDVGDDIITAGGLHGTVLELGDDDLRLKIAPDVVVTLDRRAVAAVATEVDVEVEVDADDEDDAEVKDPEGNLRAARGSREGRLTCTGFGVSPVPSDPRRTAPPRPRRRGSARRSRVTVQEEPPEGPRPPGRARDRPRGAAAQGPQADERGSRPLRRHHAEPRRQARRFGAGDRRQDPNQIVIELAGVHNVGEAAALIGKTAQLELYDLETSLVSPSVGAGGVPIPNTRLYDLLTRVQAKAGKGEPSAYYLFDSKTKRRIAGPATTENDLKKDQKVLARAGKRGSGVPARRDEGAQGAAEQRRRDVLRRDLRRLSRPEQRAAAGPELLLPLRAPPRRERAGGQARSAAHGPAPEADGNAAGLRPDHWPAPRDDAVHGQGQQDLPRRHAAGGDPGPHRPVLQHFAIVLDNEIRSFPYIDYEKNPDGIDPPAAARRSPGWRVCARRRTWHSCSRPAPSP